MWVHIIEFAFGLDGSIFILWIIHGSPVEGRLNWDVVLLSRVLGGSRALGRKFFVVPNIGAGTREMRAMMVWGLSLCLATAWVQGISPLLACGTWFLSSFAGLEGGGLKCTRGGARGDRPLSGRRCRFTVSLPYCVYCYLPGFGLWGIVDAWYIWTLRRRLYHLTCLSALDLLFGACWTALHVVGVSLFCEAGSAVSGLVTRQLWWPWFACLASACEALMMHIIYFEHFVDVSVQSHMPVSAGLGCLGHVGRRYTW